MIRHKFAILASIAMIALFPGAVWAQAVGVNATTVLQTSTTSAGQPIEYPLFRNQVTALLVEIVPGGQSGRHMHLAPMFIYILEGELTSELDGQPPRLYKTGQAFVESPGVWHNATNRAGGLLKFVALLHGEEGKPITVRP
jgi:quercetin dioxygenase-like cupin family protein